METVLTCRLQLVFRPRLRLIFIAFERSAKWTKPQQLQIPATDNDGQICQLAKVYLATVEAYWKASRDNKDTPLINNASHARQKIATSNDVGRH